VSNTAIFRALSSLYCKTPTPQSGECYQRFVKFQLIFFKEISIFHMILWHCEYIYRLLTNSVVCLASTGFGRKWSWPNRDSSLTFPRGTEENYKKKLRIAGVPANIRSSHFRITSLKCQRYVKPLGDWNVEPYSNLGKNWTEIRHALFQVPWKYVKL
jgi:hypothetical protein